jgi:hypothetical protein
MQRRTACSLALLALWALGAAAQPRSGRPSSDGAPDIEIAGENGCGPGPYLKPNMQDCAIDQMMGSNATMTFGFKVDPKAAKKHAVLLTLRSVGGAALMWVPPEPSIKACKPPTCMCTVLAFLACSSMEHNGCAVTHLLHASPTNHVQSRMLCSTTVTSTMSHLKTPALRCMLILGLLQRHAGCLGPVLSHFRSLPPGSWRPQLGLPAFLSRFFAQPVAFLTCSPTQHLHCLRPPSSVSSTPDQLSLAHSLLCLQACSPTRCWAVQRSCGLLQRCCH